ncbi:LuxR family transcriptional regulator [Clostridium carboxidivorans P7]|uniref:Stage 0 sporulation protein A homolog n=1 Tax=Clostridium carboxidivorans P7 TaxID=536227 RepID=C6PXX3_9CLOT|nr:response regulator transcription factor [Clostridium carboxidivorans]AKN31963.1 LuxR family transcriptional regulator [Clostridium carboxidivorans P7]EET85911.1 two component transcriptional regulator, LuxR family [Clostridium carboxidivorans P7]
MKIIIISNYSVIREGIVTLISKFDNLFIQFVGETIKESMFMIKSNMADIILLDLNKDNEDELHLISELISSGKDIKVIIVDFYENNEFFVKALKSGVQGYVLGKSNEEEILYAIERVYEGKKYFDSYFVDSIINKDTDLPNKLELLTNREREILIEVAKGLSNPKISEKFFITENTVKKHINHILNKLNIKDRTEAALYWNRYVLMNKNGKNHHS